MGYWQLPNVWPTLDGFAGTFDGQGHTISGMYYNGTAPVSRQYSGVGFISRWYAGGDVKNLAFDNIYLYALNAGDSVGLIAGIRSHNTADYKTSKIENVYVGENVTISAGGTTAYIGGLVGDSWASQDGLTLSISNVTFAGNIVPGNAAPGALIGRIQKHAVTVSDFVYYRATSSTGKYVSTFSNSGTLNGKATELAAKGEMTRCYILADATAETAMLTEADPYIVATEKGAMSVKLADMMSKYKWQSTEADETTETFSVRIVGELASVMYDAVGFKVTLYKDGTLQDTKSNIDNTEAYTGVKAAGATGVDTVTASAFNTGFMDGEDNMLFVFTLSDLDATATWKIEVVAVYTIGTDVIESAIAKTTTVAPYVAS